MTQTSDTLLRLQDVSKRFGKKTALDHISLEIAPGRMVGLLGSNGSGKSTLIKLINGLLVPSSGQIFICGQTPGPETKAIVSYLPERTYLPDTVRVKGLLSLITLIALPTMAYFSPEDLLELRTMFQSYHTIFTVPSILFLAIPVMIIGSVFSLLTIYASISLGQLFSSHKVLASILCYLGLSTILSTAMMLLTAPTTAGVFIIQSTSANPMADFASIYWSIMLISLFANLILCVPAFWICNYVMKRCLNLD